MSNPTDRLIAALEHDESEPEQTEPQRRFRGLSHREVLEADVPASAEIIEGIVEEATLGTICGVPETFKSFLALQMAHRIAAGGSVLDRAVRRTGPVGYFWGDDTKANELRRIKTYAKRQGLTGDLPIRWYLNQNLVLPDDIDYLLEEIETHGLIFCVVDSFYNTIRGLVMKDEEVAQIFDMLKRQVCDKTGCTIALVDHSAWPSEGNRGQPRAYGSVFKGAAVRWTVFIERLTEDRLRVQCHANNLVGLKRTHCEFDEDELELRLIPETAPVSTESVAEKVEAFILDNSPCNKREIREAVPHGVSKVDAAIKLLVDEGKIHNARNGNGHSVSGRPGDRWVHASITSETSTPPAPVELFDDVEGAA